jgi:dephospho-CoA kinase
MGTVICITGPMAAGKNELSLILEEFGWLHIDADMLAHFAIDNCKEDILKTFLPYAKKKNINLLKKDGSINRKELGRLLFSDSTLLKKQEEIIYPNIRMTMHSIIQDKQHPNIILNVTLLYRFPEILKMCDFIIYVKAGFFTRLFRAKKRDNLSYKQILLRFKAQKNLLKEYQKFNKEIIFVKNNNKIDKKRFIKAIKELNIASNL